MAGPNDASSSWGARVAVAASRIFSGRAASADQVDRPEKSEQPPQNPPRNPARQSDESLRQFSDRVKRADDEYYFRRSQAQDNEPWPSKQEVDAQDRKAELAASPRAATPLALRERMHEVNGSLDKMRQTLPEQQQVRFDEFREKLNDQMYDRLAQVRHQSQKPAGAQPGEERQMRERDVRTKTEPQQETSRSADSGREAQAKAAAANKTKAKSAEQQNRRTQRSQENEYDR